MGTDTHIPLTDSPPTEAERTRLLGLLDELAGVLGMPSDWGTGTRIAQFGFDVLRLRFLLRSASTVQDMDAEEARINAMIEAAASAQGAIAADESITAQVRLSLLGMLAESADELCGVIVRQQGQAALHLSQAAPGGAA
jgi:hypothetical protein